MVHWRLIDGSVKVKGFPVRQCVRVVASRVVSSVISRQAVVIGDSWGSMLPDIGARWWLAGVLLVVALMRGGVKRTGMFSLVHCVGIEPLEVCLEVQI